MCHQGSALFQTWTSLPEVVSYGVAEGVTVFTDSEVDAAQAGKVVILP